MAGFFDDLEENTTSPVGNSFFDDLGSDKVKSNNDSDFIPGLQRGIQNLQAAAYGAGALAGSVLKKVGAEETGQKLQDFGIEGYQRNIKEAEQFTPKHSFKDVYTGEAGIGGAIDWAQGTLGELVPSMAEAAIGAAIGAGLGTAVEPGGGTLAGTGIGAFAGRTMLKKGIDKLTKEAIQKGVGDLTEAQIRKQVTRQALKKAGGKVGIGASVMPLESGGMYAELLEDKGIDAPETALMFGALATSLEFLGGNSKLVDTFVDSLSSGAAGAAKKSAKEILTNIPQEALQEGGQELFAVLNTVANTDEKLLTAENVERIIESMGAGAIGGGAGAIAQTVMNPAGSNNVTPKPAAEPVTPKLFQQEQEDAVNDFLYDTYDSQEDLNFQNEARIRQNKFNKLSEKDLTIAEIKQYAQENNLSDIEAFNQLKQKINSPEVLDRQRTLNKAKEVDARNNIPYQAIQTYAQRNNISYVDAFEQLKQQQIPTVDDRLNTWIDDTVQQQIVEDEKYKSRQPEIKQLPAGQGFELLSYEESAKRLGIDFGITPNDIKLLPNGQGFELLTPDEAAEQRGENISQQKKDQIQQIVSRITKESDPTIRQKLYNQMFIQPGVRSAEDAAQTFQELDYQQDSDILTNQGTAYKNINALMRKLDAMPNAQDYEIIETNDGFVGRLYNQPDPAVVNNQDVPGKVFPQFARKDNRIFPNLNQGKSSESSFKNEQQDRVFPQFQTSEAPEVSYDGEKDGLHYHTIQSGPAKGATFASLTNDPEEVNQRLEATLAKFQNNYQAQIGENQEAINKVKLTDIERAFLGQSISQSSDGTINVQFKNGKGLTIKSIQDAGQGYIKLAIETGQMSKDGKILGITTGNEILLDAQFADNMTLWHENKHVLDNLGMITPEDNSLLNREFNKLRKANKLNFALSTHEDAKQRMVENRANMFAQIMVNREQYRNTAFGKVIQRVMDFFNQLLSFGKQTVSGLAREVESGKIYERQVNGQTIQTTVPQLEQTANKWYSTLENTVDGFQQKQATPDQWKGMIKNQPGIKQEELDWIGLDDWLDRQEGKVTKDSLMKFIQENNVQLEEVVRTDTENKLILEANRQLYPYGYQYEEEYGEWNLVTRTGGLADLNDVPQEVRGILANMATMALPEGTKYSSYQLPGGENYKELLLIMPNKQTSLEDDAQLVYGKSFADLDANELTTLGPKADQARNKIEYQSSHWSEPNILAHIRFNERTDAQGNKVLFIEEVQSDWHQEGRKIGYQNKNFNRELLLKEKENLTFEALSTSDPIKLNEINKRIKDILKELTFAASEILDAPFKKSWPLLVMKRMVRYAAENGFDKIAWTTGQQQADRYNLSNMINGLNYSITGKDSTGKNIYDVSAFNNIDGEVYTEFGISIDRIEQDFGKEIANKIANSDKYQATISGVNLQVGGEGMKTFYDKMLPSMLNKEFNRGKWGKAKVELVTLGNSVDDILAGTDTNVTTQLSLPITNRMRSKALREGMPLFQTSEQRLPQSEYNEVFERKNNLLKKIAQTSRLRLSEVRLFTDKALGSISTRLNNVYEPLAKKLRWLDFTTNQEIIDVLNTAKPLLDARKNMSDRDKSEWNWARLNSDKGKITQIAAKYGLNNHLELLREKMNKIREEAIKVGYDVNFIDEYWPRVIKDQEGFLQATQGISQRAVFTEAFRAKAKEMGITQEEFERNFPEVKADIISNLILGISNGIGGPGNIQSRVFETIPKEYAEFYMDADAALMQYIYSMTKKIEARKFFGKVPQKITNLKAQKKRHMTELVKLNQLADMARIEDPEALQGYEEQIINLNENLALVNQKLNDYRFKNPLKDDIGTYIDRLRTAGHIQEKDEKMVRDILEARFQEHGTHGIVNMYKNLAYIDTMGSPLSAITQIGDLAWAMYVGKVWTPRGFSNTVKNINKALFNKSRITKEDIGIERIAQEFADGTTLGNAVNKVFKMVGLEKIDSIGKEVLINNALDNYKLQAQTDPEALARSIKPIFGNKSREVVQEILSDNPSDNIKMLLYSKLLDFQPVALSEMPELYLKGGNGRVFYMLKTYTLKQMDVFRREVWHTLKNSEGNAQQKVQAIANMVQLLSLLSLANATADEIKDWMLGKETSFSDNVIDNLLTMGGASKYLRMQVVREGIGSALTQQILPPMKFINAASKDAYQGYNDYVAGDTARFDHARIIDSIPVGGKLYYWHYGRGLELKESLDEQNFKKDGKDARLFKRQLENSDDKRFFIQSNLDRFKQMKVYENYQAALSRNQAVINKLEKLESTANIEKRLGQLKSQREIILKRYFDRIDFIN